MDTFNKETQNLFLEINPNIDEIAKEAVELDDEADIEEKEMVVSQEKNKHEDVFEEPLEKVATHPKKKKKKVTFEEPEPEPEPEPETLPMTYREKKKLETAKRKAEEKEVKRIAKEKHREEMKEKNREKARKRYWEQKKIKEQVKQEKEIEVPKKIVKESKAPLNSIQKKQVDKNVNNDMDFATFSSYMMKYEEMKQHISKQKDEELKQKQREKQKEQESKPSFYPSNYPVHLLYRKKQNKNILW